MPDKKLARALDGLTKGLAASQNTQQLFIRLSNETAERLRKYSESTGRTMVHIAEAAFTRYLDGELQGEHVNFDPETLVKLHGIAYECDRTVAYIIKRLVKDWLDDCESDVTDVKGLIGNRFTAKRISTGAGVGMKPSKRDMRSIDVPTLEPGLAAKPPRKLKASGNVEELEKNEE